MIVDDFVAAIEQTRSVLTPSDIRWFEQQVGHTLPSDYRDFLERCSGGEAEFEVSTDDDSVVCLSHILGLEDLDRRLLLGYSLVTGSIEEVRIPIPMLPIAYTDGGDPLCMCLDADAFGAIYHIDHDCGGLDIATWARTREEIDAEFRAFASFTDMIAHIQ
ncbi:SMI1/KNR4 family protein [Prosthecobacter sp.]|uniref:SMI1/KNR4 family protein n=1 Tax=Prosthecobacter sp. TaxID=1965333 RepID=UPI001D5F0550|nr:SMI1/KNR4 family protein [Prosthecobacter sp.]MCB1276482.1 SMI1/KNR4 family protein [Prosthecobacter sp.]